MENDLISSNQSGFKPGNSNINLLFSITHESCKSFDCGYEVRGVFLDISKAFDKVWHNSVMLKLEQNGLPDHLCDILQDVLNNQKQRIVLNGQVSSWATATEILFQKYSILSPLFFLAYTDDWSEGLASNSVKLTSFFLGHSYRNSVSKMFNSKSIVLSHLY